MKKLFLALLLVTFTLVANAATKYEINVAGVEVTSDNASHITGGNIDSGYGVYNSSTNTLTLYDIDIYRTGQDNYGIHNRKCDNLTIVFSGSCSISTFDNALKLERSTTIKSASGSSTTFRSTGRICANLKSYNYYIDGSGSFEFISNQSGYEAIKGNGSGSTNVYFKGGKLKASSATRSALSSFAAIFYSGNHLEVLSNGSNQSISDVTMQFYSKEEVISPYQAVYRSSEKTVCVGSTPITDKTIIISDDYVAILNSSYFPDANFRGCLVRTFTKGYLNSNDVNNTKTINASGEYISNLQGIGYFSKLENFDCSENQLSSLPTLPSTLKTFRCGDNQLTSLPTLPSTLKILSCENNRIASLSNLNLPDNIEELNCSGNKFTSLDFDYHSTSNPDFHNGTKYLNLRILNCSNNPLLTEVYYNLDGSSTAAMATLNVSGCTSLTKLFCYNSKITSIANLPSSLKILNLNNNLLTSLPSMPSGLENLYVYNNKLTSFSYSNSSSIKYISFGNNPVTTATVCNNSNLTNLAFWATPSLINLYCYGNSSLKNIDLDASTALKIIDCHSCALQNLAGLSNCSALETLDCHSNQLTSLSVQGLNYLTTLEIYDNGIKESAMGTLVNSLRTIPAGSSGEFKVLGGQGEGNVITNAQVKTARNKRWLPKQYDGAWVEIPVNDDVTGDVNGDGFVTSADVTAIYDVMLGTNNQFATTADVNGDGYVTSADVTAIYDIMLGN